jgi:hypothetical protein
MPVRLAVKAITSADIKGRIGPGGVEGLLVTFERSGLGRSPPVADVITAAYTVVGGPARRTSAH